MDEHLASREPYPAVLDPERVGTYPASACAGGGYVWDAVLEYRVWCHPEEGAPNVEGGSDCFYSFRSYEEALRYSQSNPGTEEPLALVLQREYIDEPEDGEHRHVRQERITEWPVEFLRRPRRDEETLARFFAPDAPANRLDIIRGLAEWPD
jgi:hypothetical protein